MVDHSDNEKGLFPALDADELAAMPSPPPHRVYNPKLTEAQELMLRQFAAKPKEQRYILRRSGNGHRFRTARYLVEIGALVVKHGDTFSTTYEITATGWAAIGKEPEGG